MFRKCSFFTFNVVRNSLKEYYNPYPNLTTIVTLPLILLTTSVIFFIKLVL